MSGSFHCLNLGITKCYLLRCSEGYLLIDTAYPQDYEKFVKSLAKIGVDPSAIRYLLLTHHHDDHAGFAARLVERTGCRVIVHRDAILPLSRGISEETMEPVNRCTKIVLSLFEMIHKEFEYPPLVITDRDIVLSGDESDLLKGLGIDGRILHTPGHSSDSISVVLSDGSAFVGDAAMNFLHFCHIRYRPIYVEDRDLVFESWHKLTEHGAKRIYPAHGRPFPAGKLTYYREKFTNR